MAWQVFVVSFLMKNIYSLQVFTKSESNIVLPCQRPPGPVSQHPLLIRHPTAFFNSEMLCFPLWQTDLTLPTGNPAMIVQH